MKDIYSVPIFCTSSVVTSVSKSLTIINVCKEYINIDNHEIYSKSLLCLISLKNLEKKPETFSKKHGLFLQSPRK